MDYGQWQSMPQLHVAGKHAHRCEEDEKFLSPSAAQRIVVTCSHALSSDPVERTATLMPSTIPSETPSLMAEVLPFNDSSKTLAPWSKFHCFNYQHDVGSRSQ